MSDLAVQSSGPAPLPSPRRAVEIVPATLADVDWIDDLQRRHRDGVGWHPRGAIEQKIGAGEVLVARMRNDECRMQNEDKAGSAVPPSSPFSIHHSAFSISPVGYCMASDRYMKREDVGIVYQMNVEPAAQRGFVGAALLRAQFERSAYGVRLYCCWCAQDLAANRFWEAMGFVPLAFRAGSARRGRVHIFWQRRIRAGDVETPWWFPSRTQGGSMDDRLVFPIPPGTHWSDVKPVILPGSASTRREARALESAQAEGPKQIQSRKSKTPTAAALKPQPLCGGLRFAPPEPAPVPSPAGAGKARPKREKAKTDPKLIAAARELRDRWLEHVNGGKLQLESCGKYDVSRGPLAPAPRKTRLLPNPRAA